MNMFIDESGSFVSAPEEGSWNCVVAYMSPEPDSRRAKEALKLLKRKAGAGYRDEVKLGRIDENTYFEFLSRLGELNGILFAVATDSFFNSPQAIVNHQDMQVKGILRNIPRMKYQGGKDAVQLLAEQIGRLSPQLYAQLHCQVHLIDDALRRGVLYFVQRLPRSLGKFRWRVDQKNSDKPTFISWTPISTVCGGKSFSLADGIYMHIRTRVPVSSLPGRNERTVAHLPPQGRQ